MTSFWIQFTSSVFRLFYPRCYFLADPHSLSSLFQDSDADTAVEFLSPLPIFFNSQAYLRHSLATQRFLSSPSSPDTLSLPFMRLLFHLKTLSHQRFQGSTPKEHSRVLGRRTVWVWECWAEIRAFPKRERRSVFSTRKTSSWKSYFAKWRMLVSLAGMGERDGNLERGLNISECGWLPT